MHIPLRSMFLVLAACITTASADPVLITADATIGPGDTTITATAGGPATALADADITVQGATLTVNGRHTIGSLVVQRSASNIAGVVTHSSAFRHDYSGGAGTDIVCGMDLHILGDALVQGTENSLKASRIDAGGRGWPGGQGAGAGHTEALYTGGGGYGGTGGRGTNSSGGGGYGSPTAPADLGSGGGTATNWSSGGSGGGCIRLRVDGALTVNGVISANGAKGTFNAGGGSGGSLWISCGSLAGTGSIVAMGGDHSTTGTASGGGGRIAIDGYSSLTFASTPQAFGGNSGTSGRGGAGTVFIKPLAQRGALIVDNGGIAGASTELAGQITIDGDLVVRSHGVLTAKPLQALHLHITGDAEVGATGSISATGMGYPGGEGPGAGSAAAIYPGGGGYGGAGGNGQNSSGGGDYGSAVAPTDFGSGGGNATGWESGGAGGGALRLTVDGTLTVNGQVTSNGGLSGLNAGAGSGGSLWITAHTLLGEGTINASGGGLLTPGGGGGGGGRIAIYCCDLVMPVSRITASGSNGHKKGATGTVRFGSSSINIFLEPDSTTYRGGDEVSLVVDAVGDGDLTFQWYREDAPVVDGPRISGAGTTQLTFHPIDCADGGTFYCLASDACGVFPSNPAEITVLAPSDYDQSGFVDLDDFITFVGDFELGVDDADFDRSGFVDLDDFIAFVRAFEAGC